MPSRTYDSWVANGRPVSGLARPAAKLRDRLRGYGYTVYDIGNDDHLRHVPPEDHTPYSDTGWPVDPPFWWITAIDIMPPPSGKNLPSLAALAKQIHDDRNANDPAVTWVKYMNWEPGDGQCLHCSWQPSHAQKSSSDRGHIHISTCGDVIDYAGGDDYDPVARLRGEHTVVKKEEDDMARRKWVAHCKWTKDGKPVEFWVIVDDGDNSGPWHVNVPEWSTHESAVRVYGPDVLVDSESAYRVLCGPDRTPTK